MPNSRVEYRAFASVLVLIKSILVSAVAQSAQPQTIEAAPLASDAFAVGALTLEDGALPPHLWRGADAVDIEFLLDRASARPITPASGELLKRMLLSGGPAPANATPALQEQKIVVLLDAGFHDAATTISGLSQPNYPKANAIAALYRSNIQDACSQAARTNGANRDTFWLKLRVLCYAASGEPNAADLTLNVLEERRRVSQADVAFLNSAIAGRVSAQLPPIESAMHFAIARGASVELSPALLISAPGGVLVAVANDATIDLETRTYAVQQSVSMGVLGVDKLAEMFEAATFTVAELGNVSVALNDLADNPVTDALAYQAIGSMSAPEFARDKANLIARALGAADSYPRAIALAKLYAGDIAAMDGLVVSPKVASAFAQSMMVSGNAKAAGDWVSAMVADNLEIPALPEDEVMAFIDRASLLSYLDPPRAQALAARAGAKLDTHKFMRTAPTSSFSNTVLADIVGAALNSTRKQIVGQAGLVAIAVSDAAFYGAAVESVLFSHAMGVAGQDELRAQFEFEKAWATFFLKPPEPETGVASLLDNDNLDNDNGGMQTPSMKPR